MRYKSAGMLLLGGVAAALIGCGTASAQPGIVSAQDGSTVDVDGTQGTMVPATSGDQRGMATQATDGHAIVGDACDITGKGCLPPASFDPRTISATTGVSGALDSDGFQTNN